MPKLQMTSVVVYKGDLSTECTHLNSGSIINTDAPVDNKGRGRLFSPTDLMGTSLASCMITVMAIRAAESGIPFKHIKADVVKGMESKPRRIGSIHIRLYIEEKWNEKEKVIMERVARECPVALSLHPSLTQLLEFVYLS